MSPTPLIQLLLERLGIKYGGIRRGLGFAQVRGLYLLVSLHQ
jgi:hypothetical protein